MISRGVLSGGSVSVDVKNNEFVFEVRKSSRGKLKTAMSTDLHLTQ